MTSRWAAILLLITMALINACAHVYTARGAHYRVRKGDTLAGIAQRYHVSLQELAEANNIEHEEELKPGHSIFIPKMTPGIFATILRQKGIPVRESFRSRWRERVAGGGEGPESQKSALAPEEDSQIEVDHDRFAWPIEGEVSSLYGMRRGRRHDGVDIRAKMGTLVRVAAAGEVVYSKRMRGYGNLILVRHEDDFFTVYAHNAVNLVKEGSKLKKGQVIAKVGRTGRATGPHLHFEVREGASSRNPLFFLPKTVYAQKARERGSDYGGPEAAAEDENP